MMRTTMGVAAAVAASMLAGCTAQSPPTDPVTPTASSTSGSTGSTLPGSQTLDEAPAVIADGRHPIYLQRIDEPKRTITVDLVIFLTGEAAKVEWAKTHPGESDPPNDYVIVNNNPRLRELPVAAAATTSVISLTGPSVVSVPITFEELTGQFGSSFQFRPFWINVANGVVTQIDEQYVP